MVASTVGELAPTSCADRHLARRDDTVERRGDVGVAEIDLGLPLIGLRRLQVGLR